MFLTSDDDDDSNVCGSRTSSVPSEFDRDSDIEIVDNPYTKKLTKSVLTNDEYDTTSDESEAIKLTNTAKSFKSSTPSDESNSIGLSSPTFSSRSQKKSGMLVSIGENNIGSSSPNTSSYELNSPCTSSGSDHNKYPKSVAIKKKKKKNGR